MTEILEAHFVQEKDVLLGEIYQSVFPPLCKYISKRGGSLEEAKDIFHDALIIYVEKNVTSIAVNDEKAYVFGIAKHLWNKEFKEKLRYAALDSDALTIPSERTDTISSRLLLFLKQTGSKCMDILQAFYYENQNAEKIAEQFGYSSVRSATVQKFKCLEKVRDLVKSNAQTYEDFIE
ncbi:RNA polymerase sigma factor [Cytophaga aurantiaca]|uniref:RNA polymerase sigma factor n=1 Tax=Cytophaga aurantiaca TaxID=29530 RepID=UPI000380291C|nr:sigma-70 family RNA polymerase sigma factor [Cytophaga aurantiaca]